MPTKEELLESLAWMHRFKITLAAECELLFGRGWTLTLDQAGLEIMLHKDGAMIRVPMHPGSHVVTPYWAAHRYAEQLHFAAIAQGLVPPPQKAIESHGPS